MTKAATKEGAAMMSITVPVELKAQLEEAAKRQDRTVGVIVKRAIDHYLNCPSASGGCPHDHDERGLIDAVVRGPDAYLEEGNGADGEDMEQVGEVGAG